MITWDEIKPFLRTLLRWWWVVVLAVALSSGTAFYLSQREVRYYVAHTTLMVGNTLESLRPDQYQLSIGVTLARFYGELAHRERILQPVHDQLQLPFPWQIIRDSMLTIHIEPSANLLEIYITDSHPDRAAAIANAIGEQLIAYSPNSPEKIEAEQRAIEQQLRDAENRIKQIKAKIDELTARQQEATSASDLAEINQTLDQLNTSLAQEQNSFNSLLAYKNSSVVNSLSFFERAVPPPQPLPSKRKITVGIAGLAGLLISMVAILLLEQVDKGWRGARDIEDRFNLDNLGDIPVGPPLLAAPRPFAEERQRAARDVQTNILLAAAEHGTRTLMITSPQPSESRAAFSIDLADLFARAGHRVLIVDAEFAASFLTRMLAPQGDAQTWTVMSGHEYDDLWVHLRPTPLQNVALLPGDTSGVPRLIPSLRWRELVQRLLNTADVIIFDGPAALSGPDAALLAPHVDGVVLALDPATDNREDVTKSKARLLHQKGTRLLGAVTFTVPKPQLGRSSIWPQLRGQEVQALPAAHASGATDPTVPTLEVRAPIITPPPAMSEGESEPAPAPGHEPPTPAQTRSATVDQSQVGDPDSPAPEAEASMAVEGPTTTPATPPLPNQVEVPSAERTAQASQERAQPAPRPASRRPRKPLRVPHQHSDHSGEQSA